MADPRRTTTHGEVFRRISNAEADMARPPTPMFRNGIFRCAGLCRYGREALPFLLQRQVDQLKNLCKKVRRAILLPFVQKKS